MASKLRILVPVKRVIDYAVSVSVKAHVADTPLPPSLNIINGSMNP